MREEPSAAEMTERGRAWLRDRLQAESSERPRRASRAEIALAVAALERCGGEFDCDGLDVVRDAPELAAGSAQSADWYAYAAWSKSPCEGDRRRAEAARGTLRSVADADRELPSDESAPDESGPNAALRFLKGRGQLAPAAGSSAEELERFAVLGGRFDLRLAAQSLRAAPDGHGLAARLRLEPLGGRPQDVHAAARVFAAYGSPIWFGADGLEQRWPARLLESLRSCWRPEDGAWSGEPDAPPTLAATAQALLALDAIRPWNVESALDPGAMREGEQKTARSAADCIACHERQQPGLHRQWETSRHAAAGVGCADCHGTDHSTIFREVGRVPAATCAVCHPEEASQFERSSHARAYRTLYESALFEATDREARSACFGCHATGAVQRDGSVGSCNACHPAHAFDAAAAREPEACTSCHTGADYPQDQAYRLSRHGALYASRRDASVAPTCASCHMPNGVHDDRFGITIGGRGTGGFRGEGPPPVPMRFVSDAEFAEARGAMIGVCAQCHSSRFAREALAQADRVKEEGDALLARAVEILRGLHDDGLLAPDAEELVLGGEQLRIGTATPGEDLLDRFYTMWRFDYASSWKGAYHSAFGVTNHGSGPSLGDDLRSIEAGAARLRGGR